jgi:hypothetical protein
MDQKTLIKAVAFTFIFLSALFLFMRNYPSDRWFSVVFIVAGGVLLWCAQTTTSSDTTTTTDMDKK